MKHYNVVIPSELGTFIINRNDIGVGWQLAEYGTYDRIELGLLRDLMAVLRLTRPNLVAIDAGANIGMHSVMFSSQVGPEGKVYAFEAQRIIFNMLAGNMALNSISNVYCFHNAVSDESKFLDIPQFDYGQSLNCGSVEFGGEQHEEIGQKPSHRPESQEQVLAITLDSCGFDHADIIKIDVEGMEIKALNGARALIEKAKPLLLVEYLKSDQDELLRWLFAHDYRIYTGVGDNYLCLPESFDAQIGGKVGGLTKLEPTGR